MEKQRWRGEWRSTLIVKVLGRTFPFPIIACRLQSTWGKCVMMKISSLTYSFYVVKFTSHFDYEKAASGRPWRVRDYYLTFRPWRKNFNPKLAVVSSTMVCPKLPGIPLKFNNSDVVKRIVSYIRRPINVDGQSRTDIAGNIPVFVWRLI
ncbi:unnamed protein product [Linum tenue]|uniref:DUF4283 domain-containing protein n=1 Tax=Linum tenue TaxID=586396 RepID=A0AAV0IYU8_9ROSI|nr:unnamed protein product [Linum tenue]CAI0401467.1 unnamed protein product [Linum tenue]